MNTRSYLDWNATAPLRPEARTAMIAAMAVVGNPSSVHAEGRAAKALVERAREAVAAAVGCKPAEVVFTSGATEAASLLARLPEGHGVVVQDTAHDALWAHARPVAAGQADAAGRHILAMGLANGETGIITEPPAPVGGQWPHGGRLCGGLMLDITQAVGRIAFAFGWSGAPFAVLSAHKIGGPKGVGALIIREGVDIPALSAGGGQEQGRRSGTENIVGIAGFGAAATAAMAELDSGAWDGVAKLRNRLEAYISADAPGAMIAGENAPRLPNTTCIISPGWKGETQVMQMDLAGYAVSAGSACASGKVRVSRVLKAMGYDDIAAASAIRVSIGPLTTTDEIDGFAAAWLAQHERFRARAA